MGPRRDQARAGLICFLLVLAILAVYLPVTGFDFLTYDDPAYVPSNWHVREGLTWNSVQWAFTHSWNAEWHPLTMLSHMAACQVFGVNPHGHHLVNLLLHIANSLVLFLMLRSLTGSCWPSAFVAFVFALHPLNVEAVAWIAERKGLLSSFFGLLCLWAYGRYAREKSETQEPIPKLPLTPPLSPREREPQWPMGANIGAASSAGQLPRILPLPLGEGRGEGSSAISSRNPKSETNPNPGIQNPSENEGLELANDSSLFRISGFGFRIYYVLALLFLALGLLSKPMLITWPFVMLLLDYWPLNRFPASGVKQRGLALIRLVLEKLPFFALSLASSVTTFLVGRNWGAISTAAQTSLSSRVANSLLAYVLYIQKLIWPGDLSINYPYVFHWPLWIVLAALGVLVALSLLALWQFRKRPYVPVGWAWYLGTLVPVIGLVHFGNHFMADRYAYLTTLGLLVIVAWAGAELARAGFVRRILTVSAAAVMLVECALSGQTQLFYWQNSETIFRRAIAVNDTDFVAYQNLGLDFELHRQLAQAERCYRAALALNPGSIFALEKLANLLIIKGSNTQAVAACETALGLGAPREDAFVVHCTLGLALMKLGKPREALEHYAESIRLQPDFAPAHYNLANALAGQGQFEQACEHYRQSLRYDPDSADAHNNLAYLLVRGGKVQEAMAEFKAALELKPGMWQAHYGLAEALSRQGQAQAAADQYRQALRARPDFPEALTRLAWFLATDPEPQRRDGSEAVSLAERACRLTGYKQAGPLRALAAAYAEAGRFAEAGECAEKAQALAQATGQKQLAQQLQALRELFRANHPYREGGGAGGAGGA